MSALDDKRVAALLRGASPIERFLVSAVTAGMGEKDLDAVFEGVAPRRPGFRETVAGQRASYWMGKTREDMKREGLTDEQVAEVSDVLAKHGRQVGGDAEATATATATADRGATGPKGGTARKPEPTRAAQPQK